MNPNSLELGTILEITKTFEGRAVTKTMIVVEDPRTTIWKDDGFRVRLLSRYSGDIEFPWQVRFGRWHLDCMRDTWTLPKDKAEQMEIIGQLTEEEIDEMKDAEAYAEKQREFGDF